MSVKKFSIQRAKFFQKEMNNITIMKNFSNSKQHEKQ